MALDVPDVSDLAEFTGRDETTFIPAPQVETSLSQALLLFRIATCLTEWPSDGDNDGMDLQLAQFGVFSMADAIFLSLRYTTTLAKPFQSETIGSYSYSKAANAVANKLPTGVSWFDMATDMLGTCADGNAIVSTSISVFEHDGLSTRGGRAVKLGPKDFVYSGWPFGGSSPDNTDFYRDGYGLTPWWVAGVS